MFCRDLNITMKQLILQLLEFKMDAHGNPMDSREPKWHVTDGSGPFEARNYPPDSYHTWEDAAEEARGRAYDNYDEDDVDNDHEGTNMHVYHGDVDKPENWTHVSTHSSKDYEYCDSIKDQIHIDPKTI